MARSREDEFTAKTKQALAARAGYRCSFPGCDRPTSGPSAEGPEATANVGEACHIRAASSGPGARRYDPDMTSEERRSIENGIWMCRTHAKLIDSDEATHTVEELERWKREAEARAERALRKGGASARTSRLYGAPRTPTSRFVGREAEIAQARELLERTDAVRVTASVEGLAGIGKTELALQLVYRLARDGEFPGGIFWFDAENPDLTATWGTAIADGLDIPEGPVAVRAAHAVRHVKSIPEPMLVILDNVETWTSETSPRPLPESVGYRLLVTTRRRRLGGNRFRHVKVGFLEDEPARELLEAVSGRALRHAPGFDDLVGHLGGHTLAVELAGAFLGEYPEITPAAYLAELKAGGEVEAEVSDQVRYERTVTQAFAAQWQRLDEETRSAWRLAACFEPEPVTLELSETVGLNALLRGKLRRLHLIEGGEDGRWWMHRLTRQFGRSAGPREAWESAQQDFVRGCATFADDIELADGFHLYLPNRPHLDTAVALGPEILTGESQTISRFQNRVATGLQSAGAYLDAQRLFEMALQLNLETLGENHPVVAEGRSDLAIVLGVLGNLSEAKDLLEAALLSDLENLDPEHPSIATKRSNLAIVLKDLGDIRQAETLQRLALSSDLKTSGNDSKIVALRRSQLAIILLNECNKEGEAEHLLRLALETNLRHRGPDHPNTINDRANLARVLRLQGNLEEAKEFSQQALESTLRNHGEDHPNVVHQQANQAFILMELQEFKNARDIFDRVLKAQIEILGRNHPDVAIATLNLAQAESKLDNPDEAAEQAQKALEIAESQPEGSRVRTGVGGAARKLLQALAQQTTENRDASLTQQMTKLSEPSFKKVWDNPEDADYDDL
jgi:tetratricopeptide (TPR) repeat protein